MSDKNSTITTEDNMPSIELGKVSEIARNALKAMISEGKPAIPPYYEKAFYHKATEMGETELIRQISSKMPFSEKEASMIEGVSAVISNLSHDRW